MFKKESSNRSGYSVMNWNASPIPVAAVSTRSRRWVYRNHGHYDCDDMLLGCLYRTHVVQHQISLCCSCTSRSASCYAARSCGRCYANWAAAYHRVRSGFAEFMSGVTLL
jgi:hypothetical protein